MLPKAGLFLAAIMTVSPTLSHAQSKDQSAQGIEVALGVLDHGVRKPFRQAPPAGFTIYEGEEERDTVDIQLTWRSRPLTVALKPRLTAKLQLNTGGRTNFASAGAEWRQHVLNGRIYGQVGIGVAVHDGYLQRVDPFAPGIGAAEAERRFAIYSRRTAFGSPVLFNPNLSLGLRLDKQWAVELAYEHYSHRRLFASQNPGINMVGVRLVRNFGE